MAIAFSQKELITVAMGIERNGAAFYDFMAANAQGWEIRAVFRFLADMERGHLRLFKSLEDENSEQPSPERNTIEHASYLRALIDNTVFTEDIVTTQRFNPITGDEKALEIAIGAEKDSIIFYQDMRDSMSDKARVTIEKIISEEKLHLKQLSDLKKDLLHKS